MDQYVVCINRENPGDEASRIVEIGIASLPGATAREILQIAEVRARHESGTDAFFTIDDGGGHVRVVPRHRNGVEYLTTEQDGEETGNLDHLPECSKQPLVLALAAAMADQAPEPQGEPVRAVDLDLGAIVMVAVGFVAHDGLWVSPMPAPPGLAHQQMLAFFARYRGLGMIQQPAALMAESFRNYVVSMQGWQADDYPVKRSWPADIALRVIVDTQVRDANGTPQITLLGLRVGEHTVHWVPIADD